MAAFDSGWIAPVGPELSAFEAEVAACVGMPHAAALASGTAALHLALSLLGVGAGDEVLVASFTFTASANAVRYLGAEPVFVDCDASWTIDPQLVGEALADAARRGRLPKAVIAVDLFGQSADYDALRGACEPHGVPIIQDAAEALGSRYRGAPVGGQGDLSVLSFNGNKIITTSGGGMLLARREDWVARARFLATQARESAAHYEHRSLGYNYRLSNLLAALGRAQLRKLGQRVEARRRNFQTYAAALGALPGWTMMPESGHCRSSRWLSCATIDPAVAAADNEAVRRALEARSIEARPLWKPLHLQPLYAGCRCFGGAVSERLFAQGLCLPSGSDLTGAELETIVGVIRGRPAARAGEPGQGAPP